MPEGRGADEPDQAAQADPAKRGEFYAEAQKLAWEGAPRIFLGVPQNISARTNTLSGVYMPPDRGFLLEEAEFAE